jgi:hypothetical protein
MLFSEPSPTTSGMDWRTKRRRGGRLPSWPTPEFISVSPPDSRRRSAPGVSGYRVASGSVCPIARGVLHRPRMLILGKATNALDWRAGVAHKPQGTRPTTARHCFIARLSTVVVDRVVVLDRGGSLKPAGDRLLGGRRHASPSKRSSVSHDLAGPAKAQYGIGWRAGRARADRWTLSYALASRSCHHRVPNHLPVLIGPRSPRRACASGASSAAGRAGGAIRQRLVSVAHLDGALHRDRVFQAWPTGGPTTGSCWVKGRHCSASTCARVDPLSPSVYRSPGPASRYLATTPSLSRRRSPLAHPTAEAIASVTTMRRFYLHATYLVFPVVGRGTGVPGGGRAAGGDCEVTARFLNTCRPGALRSVEPRRGRHCGWPWHFDGGCSARSCPDHAVDPRQRIGQFHYAVDALAGSASGRGGDCAWLVSRKGATAVNGPGRCTSATTATIPPADRRNSRQ